MNSYQIPNLGKAVSVLKLLSFHQRGLTAQEIEKHADIPRTTAFRILKTLCAENMVIKKASKFYPGTTLFEIGLHALSQMEIRRQSVPLLRQLSRLTNFTSHLAIPSGLRSLIVEVCDSPSPVHVASRPGSIVELHCSSTGKVFLSYLFRDRLAEIFPDLPMTRKTGQTIQTLKELEQSAEHTRKVGYAVDNREFHDDVRCLAAPVFNLDGHIEGAMGITAPATVFASNDDEKISQHVLRCARQLSRDIGARVEED